jgi:hypothetical protein
MTTLMTGLMVMNYEAAAQKAGRATSGLTCNINGIPLQERARYGHLVEALRHAVQKTRELSDGFAFRWTPKKLALVSWPNGLSWNGNVVHACGLQLIPWISARML